MDTGDFKKVLGALLDFLFPAECVGCKGFLGENRFLGFCKDCWGKIEFVTGSLCFCCGKPFETKSISQMTSNFTCGNCRKGLYYFDKARAIGKYKGVLKEAIHHFKYSPTQVGMGKPGLGKYLSELLLQHLPPDLQISSFDLVIPVPLHKNRKEQRGFNQSEILAKFLSQRYHIPLDTKHLYRIKETRPQIELSSSERAENVKGAFIIRNPRELKGKKIILIDDVFTTGATVNESSRILKKAEVKKVLVLTLTRVC